MRPEIDELRVEKGIPRLLHFTRAQNLPSILANGLVPRADIDCGLCQGIVNDDLRLDHRPGYNCLSITFPNAMMFHRFKEENPDIDWPILAIHPRILATRNVLFCWHNAATKEISEAPDEQLASLEAFRSLFEERPGFSTRADQFLKTCDPTNVQAEVLVEGRIPPEEIFGIIFPNVQCKARYANLIGDRQTVISSRRGYYANRQFWRQWGDGRNQP